MRVVDGPRRVPQMLEFRSHHLAIRCVVQFASCLLRRSSTPHDVDGGGSSSGYLTKRG